MRHRPAWRQDELFLDRQAQAERIGGIWLLNRRPLTSPLRGSAKGLRAGIAYGSFSSTGQGITVPNVRTAISSDQATFFRSSKQEHDGNVDLTVSAPYIAVDVKDGSEGIREGRHDENRRACSEGAFPGVEISGHWDRDVEVRDRKIQRLANSSAKPKCSSLNTKASRRRHVSPRLSRCATDSSISPPERAARCCCSRRVF